MRGQERLYDYLAEVGVRFVYYEHPAVFTAKESSCCYRGEGTTLCKNLFLRNHKGTRHYLVVLRAECNMDIRTLETRLGQGRLSFASPERMMRHLGVHPGSVSLFSLVNDVNHEVVLFLDSQLQYAKQISFHPNDNTASLVVCNDDMMKFVKSVGNEYHFIDIKGDREHRVGEGCDSVEIAVDKCVNNVDNAK